MNAADGIIIAIEQKFDDDHYLVRVEYADSSNQPDVGLNSWLQPPGNTYETTDIWIDSPLNGYDTYRQGMWSDLMGGTVPKGNGDDPAVGQVNRLYARVRNYGNQPATNVVVHFDITDPPGLGINGSNGFIPLGTVDKNQFPGLALINPGDHVDVYYNWTPNITLTPQQIQQGRFFFHTCVRVRLDHVAGETFFANQDGNGQQENIDYFQAPAQGSMGAPLPNKDVIHLRNDSNVMPKQFFLSVLRDDLPDSWDVTVNNGNPIVNLAPAELRDVPVVVTPKTLEPAGSHHSIRVFASSKLTLQNQVRPNDRHDHFQSLGGVSFQVAALREPKLTCDFANGSVNGTISGLDSKDVEVRIYISGVDSSGQFIPGLGTLVTLGVPPNAVPAVQQSFVGQAPQGAHRAVCLYAGSLYSASVGSQIFSIP